MEEPEQLRHRWTPRAEATLERIRERHGEEFAGRVRARAEVLTNPPHEGGPPEVISPVVLLAEEQERRGW